VKHETLVEVMVGILNRHHQLHPHRRLAWLQTARLLGHALTSTFLVAPGETVLEVQAEFHQDSRMRMVGYVGKKECKLLQKVGVVARILGQLAKAAVSATDDKMCSEDNVLGALFLLVAAFRVQMDTEEEEEDMCDMVRVADCNVGGENSDAKVLLPHSSKHADLPLQMHAEAAAIPRRQKIPKVRDRVVGGGSGHCQRC
jgi:hypothetical protein